MVQVNNWPIGFGKRTTPMFRRKNTNKPAVAPTNTETWKAEWFPKGGEIVIRSHNIEFEGAVSARQYAIPDRPAYLDVFDFVLKHDDPFADEETRKKLGKVMAAVVQDRKEHHYEQLADIAEAKAVAMLDAQGVSAQDDAALDGTPGSTDGE